MNCSIGVWTPRMRGADAYSSFARWIHTIGVGR